MSQTQTPSVENQTGEEFSPVSVKITRVMKVLPQVFMTPDLVKVALTHRHLNCPHYVSHSGLTWEGCVMATAGAGDSAPILTLVRGIYYVSGSSIQVFSPRKLSRDEMGFMKIVDSMIKSMTQVMTSNNLLISYNNYGITIYSEFVKGRRIEFPLVYRQGHLSIWEIPPPSTSAKLKEAQTEQTEEGKKYGIYNHTIALSGGNMYIPVTPQGVPTVYGGEGLIMRINNMEDIVLSSPDHGEDRITLRRGWYLLTHPRPRRDVD
ncbi:MAG: hypothetical protein ACP5NY_09305 [Thermocladium sp.]